MSELKLLPLYEAINEANIWSADDAIDPVGEIFDDVVAALRRDQRFASLSRDGLDLLLADCRGARKMKSVPRSTTRSISTRSCATSLA